MNFAFLLSCAKKFECACSGYEGLKSVKRYKIKADNIDAAESTCSSYEEGTLSDGISCQIEK